MKTIPGRRHSVKAFLPPLELSAEVGIRARVRITSDRIDSVEEIFGPSALVAECSAEVLSSGAFGVDGGFLVERVCCLELYHEGYSIYRCKAIET